MSLGARNECATGRIVGDRENKKVRFPELVRRTSMCTNIPDSVNCVEHVDTTVSDDA